MSRNWLLILAGSLWTVVGVMLCRYAYLWLATMPLKQEIVPAAGGIILGLVGYRFSFAGIARKNIQRIFQFAEKGCIFAFQAWKSYLIIAVMIAFGLLLRHSSLPRYYLAVIYLAVGVALQLASLHYYALLWRVVVRRQPPRLQSGQGAKSD